ncbi:hypothetical protein U1Q18_003718 [Sarracenia purpurea var. burkii]
MALNSNLRSNSSRSLELLRPRQPLTFAATVISMPRWFWSSSIGTEIGDKIGLGCFFLFVLFLLHILSLWRMRFDEEPGTTISSGGINGGCGPNPRPICGVG